MAEAEHSGVPHWAAHRMSSLLCLLKIRLFFINISQVPQEKPWRWTACQLMDGDGDGIRTFKTNMANGASRTRACTHTHTQEPQCAVTLIHRERDVLIGQPRSVMAPKTPLMLRERVVKSTEVCFIYSLIYSIHSEGEHQWLWQAPSWCPLSSKSSLKLKDW